MTKTKAKTTVAERYAAFREQIQPQLTQAARVSWGGQLEAVTPKKEPVVRPARRFRGRYLTKWER